MIIDGDGSSIESAITKPASLLQFVCGIDSASGDDVRTVFVTLRNVAELLFERGIDISHETVRY
jgi:hypothetical protein